MLFVPQLLSGLALITLHAVAAPASSSSGFIAATHSSENSEFLVTNMYLHAPSGHSKSDTNRTVSFTLSDPNPIAKQSSICNATWVQGSGLWPQGGYTPCRNATTHLSFNFASFTNIYTFELQLQHTFLDPSLGTGCEGGANTPCYRSNFGFANVTKHELGCEKMKDGSLDCKQPAIANITVPITETDG